MPDYTKKQLWELYNALPKDLQEAASSEENSSNIREICIKNGVGDEDLIFEIIKNIGYVFLGLLPPGEFSYILEKDLKMKKDKAKEITTEITRFVFLPVKASLEALYKTAPLSPKVSPPTKEKPKKQDIYREQIE